MRVDLEEKAALVPMPVLMVAAYDAKGDVNMMNAAWGMISKSDQITLFIGEGHKTTKNIRESKAFTVSIADCGHAKEADFVGIASGNTMADKFMRTGLHVKKSEHVNAPIIDDFPICMECELEEIIDTGTSHAIVGHIVNTSVDECVLDDDGNIDITRVDPMIFNQIDRNYYQLGSKIGGAWDLGKQLMPV